MRSRKRLTVVLRSPHCVLAVAAAHPQTVHHPLPPFADGQPRPRGRLHSRAASRLRWRLCVSASRRACCSASVPAPLARCCRSAAVIGRLPSCRAAAAALEAATRCACAASACVASSQSAAAISSCDGVAPALAMRKMKMKRSHERKRAGRSSVAPRCVTDTPRCVTDKTSRQKATGRCNNAGAALN